MRHAKLAALFSITLLSMCSILFSLGLPGTDVPNGLASIPELEKLSFTPASAETVPEPSYEEVSAVRGLFLAYSVGAEKVSKYREPVLTRGAPGVAVFKTVSPAVVVVVVGSVKNDQFDPEGMGTGAIVDPRGYVLTNWHVIKDHQAAVVFLKPAASSELDNAVTCIGRLIYQNSDVDLALLKLADPPASLHSISLGDIAQVQVAEDIHIIGHPHEHFWSYSTGVVSQIRESYSWSYEDGSKHTAKVLQLQTAISPGNSGGPVVDDSGKILGLVAMSEEGQNLDYAIAADVIKQFLHTGMGMTTRGGYKSSSSRPQQILTSKLGDSPITKAIFPNLVLYYIGGKNPGLIAMFSDGTTIRAWNANAIGEFRDWAAKLSSGQDLVASASNGALTHIASSSSADYSPVSTKGAQ